MSAPMIIPFNHEPVTSTIKTSNYTVPSGKYARVYVKDSMLPTLNSVPMYKSTLHVHSVAVGTAANVIAPTDADSMIATFTSLSGNPVFFGTTSAVNSLACFYTQTVAATVYVPVKVSCGFSFWIQGSSPTLTGITYCKNPDGWFWMKSGETLGILSGYIHVEEYNVIS